MLYVSSVSFVRAFETMVSGTSRGKISTFFRKPKFLSTPPGKSRLFFRLLNMQIPCRNRPPAHPVRYQRQKRNDKENPQAGEVFFRCRQGQEGGSTPGISAPEGHLAGSTWIEMIVPSPKRARRRRSISTVSSCERATLIARPHGHALRRQSRLRCGASAGCAAPDPGIGRDDPQYLPLRLVGQRTLEQFPEPRADQVESNLENKDRHDQCCDGIGDAPPLPEEIGTSDARQRPQRRKSVAAVMPGIGDHARAFDPAPFAHRISV